MTGNLGYSRWSMKKFAASNMKNSFFELHFWFSGNFAWFPINLTPLWYHFFSCFLFHQEMFSSKNYRAFGFKLPDKKLISLRRITIFQGWMHVVHQNLLLQFFSNMECDCAADNFKSTPILHIFRRLHPTWTRCAAAFPFPACMREGHQTFFCAD